MPQMRSSIVQFIKSALHAQYDASLNEPLPERWVDLIHHLNEQERENQRNKGAADSQPVARRQVQ